MRAHSLNRFKVPKKPRKRGQGEPWLQPDFPVDRMAGQDSFKQFMW